MLELDEGFHNINSEFQSDSNSHLFPDNNV